MSIIHPIAGPYLLPIIKYNGISPKLHWKWQRFIRTLTPSLLPPTFETSALAKGRAKSDVGLTTLWGLSQSVLRHTRAT